jgi:hypothetical protein
MPAVIEIRRSAMRRNDLLDVCQKALEEAGCEVWMELVDRIGFTDPDGRKWELSKTAFVPVRESGAVGRRETDAGAQ